MKKILNQSARSSVKRYRYESTGGANSSLRSFLISSAAFATFRCWSRGNRISTFRLGLKTGSVPLQVHQDSTSCSQTTRAIASARQPWLREVGAGGQVVHCFCSVYGQFPGREDARLQSF